MKIIQSQYCWVLEFVPNIWVLYKYAIELTRLFIWTFFQHPGILKVSSFFSFYLEYWVFTWVLINFLSFACNSFDYIKMSKKLHAKSADFLKFKLEFSVLSWILSFYRLEFFVQFPNKNPGYSRLEQRLESYP